MVIELQDCTVNTCCFPRVKVFKWALNVGMLESLCDYRKQKINSTYSKYYRGYVSVVFMYLCFCHFK